MDAWLRRWLFRGCLTLAAVLVGLVVVAPFLSGDPNGGILTRILALFGHDTTLRRTGLASAAGLAVTARVFFQPAAQAARPGGKPLSDRPGE
jgi:hypothetical protein